LELGGKDPAIVLSDADIDVASSGVAVGGFFNNGQTCCSIERLLVHESIADNFLSMLNSKLAKLRVGASTANSNDLGPLTYEAQKSVLRKQFQDLGPKHADLYDGKANFLIPTLIPAKPGSKIWEEESFGPVLVYDTFKTDDEAIEKANRTDFGLAAVIWSKDTSRAQKMAKKIRAGTVVINDAPHTHAIFSLPWGGLKNSGIGRVHGEEGLRDMCHQQIVTYDILGQWKQPWWFPYSDIHFALLKNFTLFIAETSLFKKAKYLILVIIDSMKVEKRL
jgi:succinate-semialdehyde dehydrogenase/glutarate-semialdehyde dehydrogenase